MAAISFFGDLLQTISDRGRDLISFGRGDLVSRANAADLLKLCDDLISRRGEASGVALARLILDRYATFGLDERHAFLRLIAVEFDADHAAVDEAIAAYRAAPTRASLGHLHEAAEPRSQELIRRLNLARDGTRSLVRMREDLFDLRRMLRDAGRARADRCRRQPRFGFRAPVRLVVQPRLPGAAARSTGRRRRTSSRRSSATRRCTRSPAGTTCAAASSRRTGAASRSSIRRSSTSR